MVEHRESRGAGNEHGDGVDAREGLQRATKMTCGLGLAFSILFIVALLSFTPIPKLEATDA